MIDFQKRLDSDLKYPFLVLINTARWAMTVLDIDLEWVCAVHKLCNGVLVNAELRSTGYFDSFEFNIEDREIDAVLLEEVHNTVTAWFIELKESAGN